MGEQPKYVYDVFVSYSHADREWVHGWLMPQLKKAGLRIGVSGDVEVLGMPRLMGIERAITQSRHTVVVLSPAYLVDGKAEFESILAQGLDCEEGTYRLLPVKIAAIDNDQLPARLRVLSILDLTSPRNTGRALNRLLQALQEPLPS